MPVFEVLFKLSPPSVFGLPEGEKVVIPTSKDGSPRQIVGGTIDARSGIVAGHGTLSEYRRPDAMVGLSAAVGGLRVEVRDNFLRIFVDLDDANQAYTAANGVADLICQAASAQVGIRFAANCLSVQDAAGVPQRVLRPKTLQLFNACVYDTAELSGQLRTAFDWTIKIDERGRKALLYLEHGYLLSEFAQTLPIFSVHGSFSWAMAFLQLYKALSTIVGEPGTDRDYQSRAKRLGLPDDFRLRAKQLYTVRNDDDVAHYKLELTEPGAMQNRFSEAAAVFKEAFAAYMATLPAAA